MSAMEGSSIYQIVEQQQAEEDAIRAKGKVIESYITGEINEYDNLENEDYFLSENEDLGNISFIDLIKLRIIMITAIRTIKTVFVQFNSSMESIQDGLNGIKTV